MAIVTISCNLMNLLRHLEIRFPNVELYIPFLEITRQLNLEYYFVYYSGWLTANVPEFNWTNIQRESTGYLRFESPHWQDFF